MAIFDENGMLKSKFLQQEKENALNGKYEKDTLCEQCGKRIALNPGSCTNTYHNAFYAKNVLNK